MKGLGIEITLGVPAAEQRLIQERDGLRVQLADAQDRRAFLAAELQRLRDATDIVYAHRNKAQDKVVNLTAERDTAQARIVELLGEQQTLRQEMKTERERAAAAEQKHADLRTLWNKTAMRLGNILHDRGALRAAQPIMPQVEQHLRNQPVADVAPHGTTPDRPREARIGPPPIVLGRVSRIEEGYTPADRDRGNWAAGILYRELDKKPGKGGLFDRGVLTIAQDVHMTTTGAYGRDAAMQEADVDFLRRLDAMWLPSLLHTRRWDDAVRGVVRAALASANGVGDVPASITPGQTCQSTNHGSGSSSKRPCGNPATWRCAHCGRWFCATEGAADGHDGCDDCWASKPAPSWERAREAWKAVPQDGLFIDVLAPLKLVEACIYRGECGWVDAAKDAHEVIGQLEQAAKDARLWTVGQKFAHPRPDQKTALAIAIVALRAATPRPTVVLSEEDFGETFDGDTTEPTPEEPRAPTASEVRRMFAATDESASSREKPDA